MTVSELRALIEEVLEEKLSKFFANEDFFAIKAEDRERPGAKTGREDVNDSK